MGTDPLKAASSPPSAAGDCDGDTATDSAERAPAPTVPGDQDAARLTAPRSQENRLQPAGRARRRPAAFRSRTTPGTTSTTCLPSLCSGAAAPTAEPWAGRRAVYPAIRGKRRLDRCGSTTRTTTPTACVTASVRPLTGSGAQPATGRRSAQRRRRHVGRAGSPGASRSGLHGRSHLIATD
jgi:hypothetical protein